MGNNLQKSINMKYIVYLTTNIVNNKIYIGVHSTEDPNIFDGYIGNSINIFKSNPELNHPKIPFHKAVKKYGYNSFKRTTLKIFDSLQEALDLEAYIVNEEFISREDTYNITLGGGNPPLHSKAVYQYSLQGEYIREFKSLTEASKSVNGNGNLIGIASNYRRTAYNYLWSFNKYDYLDIKEYHINSPKIPVYLYDADKNFIKSYNSISECSEDLNTYLTKVQRALKLGNEINGYLISTTLSSKFPEPKINTITGDVHQYHLNGTYIKSYLNKDELKKDGFDIYAINRAIKQDQTYKNYQWVRGEKLLQLPSKEKTVHAVRAIGQYSLEGELINTFNTVREARKQFPNVSKVLRGQAKQCHGYTFKYLIS